VCSSDLTPLWVFPVGAPPPVRKRPPAITPSPPLRTRGGCSYGSEGAPGYSRLRNFCVGAPPPVRKRSPARTPSHPPSHPRRVLLRFRGRPGLLAAAGFLCRSTAPVRKRSQARTPTHPQSHPGRMLLQPVTPGGDPAQSTIAAAQPKAISGRL